MLKNYKLIPPYTKLILISIVLLGFLPLCIGDIYYAMSDNTCVREKVQIQINLKTYLETSCHFSIILIILNVIPIINLTYVEKIITYMFGFSLGGLFVNYIFNIIGGIIFWDLMDNSQCEKSVYNYVFTSLIIKYFIGTFYFILINSPIRSNSQYISSTNSDESDDFEELNHLPEVFNNRN